MFSGLTSESAAKMAAVNAVMVARNSRRTREDVKIILTAEMLENPAIFAAFIPLVEAIAAETGNEFPIG